MVGATQRHRQIAVNSPLGDDVLLFRHMSGEEQLGRLFEYRLEVLSDRPDIRPSELLGNNLTVRLTLPTAQERYFNGYASEFSQLMHRGGYAAYQIVLRPWLWFLTRTSDCRIFQNKTVLAIVREVFEDHGFADFELRLSGTYPSWEYCVQYRETAFDFISRLLEQEGIYYFFEHHNGKHLLVLVDDLDKHQAFPGYEEIELVEHDPGREENGISTLSIDQRVQPGTYSLNAFNFQTPHAEMYNSVATDTGRAFEMYDYPGNYSRADDGKRYANVRLDELQAQYQAVNGHGDCRGLTVGSQFSLVGKDKPDVCPTKLLVVATSYRLSSDAYETTPGAENEPICDASFTAIDAEQQYRTPRVTPQPLIRGPQTALVTGPTGEEIHTDQYGRVKCRFHWDRDGAADDTSSCWIRVAQNWAGKRWGALFLPRVGQEVIVEFLEGDPDRPLVTGRVYNGENKPPWELPANKTLSTLKSNSSKGGQGFNEIRYDDKKGQEQLFVHAEKNLDLRVKNDRFEWVGHDDHLIVKQDRLERIDNDRHTKIQRDHSEQIGRDRHLRVEGKQAVQIDDSQSLTVKGDVVQVFQANCSQQTSGDTYIKATNLVLEATANLTLKVGGSYVAIEAGGITIGTSATLELKAGATTTVKGGASVIIQGAVVKIN